MITREHGYADLDKTMSAQGYMNAPISVEDDVWIGFQAVILPGITIGRGSIIGTSAVVTKDVPENVVAAGVPAKVIKKIDEK